MKRKRKKPSISFLYKSGEIRPFGRFCDNHVTSYTDYDVKTTCDILMGLLQVCLTVFITWPYDISGLVSYAINND